MLAGTEREAPFAGLVALGGVGDADAGRGGELEGRAVAFKPKPAGGDEVWRQVAQTLLADGSVVLDSPVRPQSAAIFRYGR